MGFFSSEHFHWQTCESLKARCLRRVSDLNRVTFAERQQKLRGTSALADRVARWARLAGVAASATW